MCVCVLREITKCAHGLDTITLRHTLLLPRALLPFCCHDKMLPSDDDDVALLLINNSFLLLFLVTFLLQR